MRDLTEVIPKILTHIPPTEERLVATLEDICTSAYFAPPENQYLFWQLLQEELQSLWPDSSTPPPTDWRRVVIEVALGKSMEEITYG